MPSSPRHRACFRLGRPLASATTSHPVDRFHTLPGDGSDPWNPPSAASDKPTVHDTVTVTTPPAARLPPTATDRSSQATPRSDSIADATDEAAACAAPGVRSAAAARAADRAAASTSLPEFVTRSAPTMKNMTASNATTASAASTPAEPSSPSRRRLVTASRSLRRELLDRRRPGRRHGLGEEPEDRHHLGSGLDVHTLTVRRARRRVRRHRRAGTLRDQRVRQRRAGRRRRTLTRPRCGTVLGGAGNDLAGVVGETELHDQHQRHQHNRHHDHRRGRPRPGHRDSGGGSERRLPDRLDGHVDRTPARTSPQPRRSHLNALRSGRRDVVRVVRDLRGDDAAAAIAAITSNTMIAVVAVTSPRSSSRAAATRVRNASPAAHQVDSSLICSSNMTQPPRFHPIGYAGRSRLHGDVEPGRHGTNSNRPGGVLQPVGHVPDSPDSAG